MLFGLIVFGAILASVFAFVGTYNGLVTASERATRAWNDLDTLLRQRHDEIPKLIDVCEQHLPAERGLVDRLRESRAAVFAARQARVADELGRAEAGLRAAATASSRIGATGITRRFASTTPRSAACRARS